MTATARRAPGGSPALKQILAAQAWRNERLLAFTRAGHPRGP